MKKGPIPPSALLLALLLLAFSVFGAIDLDRLPKVYEDEAWTASPGYTFVTTGVYGATLFRGLHGVERHDYARMPAASLAAGVSLRLFGFGLLQARLTSLGFALLTLLLTYRIGALLFSAWHGVAAVFVLVLWPLTTTTSFLKTGIPLVDMARICRYDIPVPVFGLAAFLVLVPVLRGEVERPTRRLILAGALAGLATMGHVYGLFWLPALLASVAGARGVRAAARGAVSLVAGAMLALLPWLAFAATGWRDLRAQYGEYGTRFALVSPAFYLHNLLDEVDRYKPLLRAAIAHMSPWLFCTFLALGARFLLRRPRRDRGGVGLLVALIALCLLFALLLRSKNPFYLATIWPLLALVSSIGLVAAWERASRLRGGRAILAGLLVAVSFEGIRSGWRFRAEARLTTSYPDFTRMIAVRLPPGSRVLGMQHYWLGLGPHCADYVSALVPLLRSTPHFEERPVSIEEGVDSAAPTIILVDQVLFDLFRDQAAASAEFHGTVVAVQEYLRRRTTRVASLYDRTYGRMEIYAVRPTTADPTPPPPGP